MKRLVSPLLLVLFISSFAIGWRSSPDENLYYPISMTLAGNQLLVSDAATGLHIYDVSSPAAPTKQIRIPLRDNRSSAVKDDIIYTNQYQQLQAIRVTDDTYEVLAKIGNEYPPMPPWEGGFNEGSGIGCMTCGDSDLTAPAPAPSTGSSFATFALIDDILYRVDESRLVVYDVSNSAAPAKLSTVHVDWGIETLFPTPDYLFIGGNSAMYIFDRSNPLRPHELSRIDHTVACDPVVVEGTTAFVTLRSVNGCAPVTNELMCVNIQNPAQPAILCRKEIPSPYGLAVQNSQLFLSHGDQGFSLLDVSQPDTPAIKATWPGATRDFIWSGTTLFVLEDHNVAIYDVTDPMNPVLLSRVEPATSS